MTPASAVDSREAARAALLHEQLLLQAAHDLRSPLGALRLWIDIHGTEHGTPSPSLARIDRAAEELARIIDDMVDASRLLGGRAHLDRAATSLSDLVRRCAESLAKSGAVVTLGSVEDVRGWVDAARLERALTLLVKSLAKGDPTGMELSLAARGEQAEVRVVRVGSSPAKAPSEVSVALAAAVAELHDGTLEAAEHSGRMGWVLRIPLGSAPAAPGRETP